MARPAYLHGEYGRSALAMAAALLVAACNKGPAADTQQPFVPSAVSAKSYIKGALFTALPKLPHSPEKGALDGYCSNYRADTLTATGKKVAGLGWIVTSEEPLGPYRAVSFASGFTPGTSSLCSPRNANIAIFKGTHLVALAYTSRLADMTLGKVTPLEGGGLLVWEGQDISPIGELHAERNGLRLTELAPEQPFCGHRVVVPNIYHQPIAIARKILLKQGWRPLETSDPHDDISAELVKQGITEAEQCSGTGLGYCAFNYEAPARAATMRVITTDDDYGVASYDVECQA